MSSKLTSFLGRPLRLPPADEAAAPFYKNKNKVQTAQGHQGSSQGSQRQDGIPESCRVACSNTKQVASRWQPSLYNWTDRKGASGSLAII